MSVGPAEAEVLARFDAFDEALTGRRDAAAALALFVADDDIVMWGSGRQEVALGRPAVKRLFEQIGASTSAAKLSFRWQSRQVRIEGDVAWVNAVGEFVDEHPERGTETGPYRITALFLRRQGEWFWHTHSGSEPLPA
jgi:ketosteroid isomerase-like protein